jgi:hypothetical protein
MKHDEKKLLWLIANGWKARDAVPYLEIPQNRARYLLEDKWCARKGWWDYGVSYIGGWLTKEGQAAAEKLTPDDPAPTPPPERLYWADEQVEMLMASSNAMVSFPSTDPVGPALNSEESREGLRDMVAEYNHTRGADLAVFFDE